MKLIRALNNSIHWTKALQFAAREENEKAISSLNKCQYRDEEFWALKAYLGYAMKDRESLIEASLRCREELKTSKHSEVDRSYINLYLDDLEGKIEDTRDFSLVPLEQVSKHLKLNFPLRGHPFWESV